MADRDQRPVHQLACFHFIPTAKVEPARQIRSATRELVHQSFDWFDVPTYHYNSLTKNPAPNSTARTDGAASGVLEHQTGDELHFNCHITFTDARAAEVKLPKTAQEIGTLTFANEAYTAEMCSLLGSTVNVQLPSSPEWSTRKLPSFAGP